MLVCDSSHKLNIAISGFLSCSESIWPCITKWTPVVLSRKQGLSLQGITTKDGGGFADTILNFSDNQTCPVSDLAL